MNTSDRSQLNIRHLSPIALDDECERRNLRASLSAEQKEIPAKYLYDARGSELFEALTSVSEYYPSRAELEILERHASGLMEEFKPDEVVELGSGSSRKTRVLLEAMHAEGGARYTPLDVSEDAIRIAGEQLIDDYPWLEVNGIVADFHADLSTLENDRRRMVTFLGGTIGNLYSTERRELLDQMRTLVGAGDAFLVGFDLIKDRHTLETAYDDEAGRTRRFIFNVLEVMNREYGADFDVERFDYRAHWDSEQHWVEMQLVARESHEVRVEDLDLELDFAAGEHLRAEVSTKFDAPMIEGYLAESGFVTHSVLIDEAERYGLAVAVPAL
ncbi:MAG: L-histidine N(alpha)-methyltransferase [Planctomycetota bacterium]